jgi:signal transduction histidine kinase
MSRLPRIPTFGRLSAPPPRQAALPPQAQAVIERVGLDFLGHGGSAFVADAAGRLIWANTPYRDFTERLGHPVDPDPPWPVAALTAAAGRTAGPVEREDEIAFASGAERVQSRHWLAFAGDGSLAGWAGAVIEPPPSDRLRHQIRAVQERLDDVTRLVSDWIWETGADLTLTFVSPRVSELLGYHPREILGRALTAFGQFVDEVGKETESPLDAARPRPFRDAVFLAAHAEGRSLQFRFAALPVFDAASGAFRGFRGTARDVTAEAAALTLVATSRSQLGQAIDSISEGFALFDTDERLVLYNRKYIESFPMTGARIRIGERHGEIFRRAITAHDIVVTPSAEPLLQAGLAERARLIEAIEWEIAGERWIRASDRPTSGGSIVSIHTDITEWKRRERALYDAKETAELANRAKSEFMANISHELRTPLNVIIGFSELIASETMGPVGNAQYKGYIADVLASGRHLLDVINDIIDLARAEAGRMELNEEPTDLLEAINAVLRMMRERAMRGRVHLEADLPPALPPILADPRKLRQILTNLVSNAIKFTHEGGIITVTAQREAPTGDVIIQVIDTGIGIAADDIPIAFKPFGQIDARLNRHYDGTGLGLPLTKVMVELHQGRITIDSVVGVGTTVTIRLPASRVRG